MTIVDRLKAALINGRRFRADPAQEAGRQAEYLTHRALASRLDGTGWMVHHGLRVPDRQTRSRRELDFVITSPKEATVVELKNWSGSVHLEGHDVIQVRRRGLGTINHGPLFRDLQERTTLLREVARRRGGPVPPCRSLVVFYNSALDIAPQIAQRKDCLSYGQLFEHLPARSLGLSASLEGLMRFLGFGGAKGRQPTPSVVALRGLLDDLGGWDVIELHGGQVIFGDILGPENRRLQLQGQRVVDRRRVRSLQLHTGRSLLMALLRRPTVTVTATLRQGGTLSGTMSPHAQLAFQRAGAGKSESVALRHVVRVQLSYALRPSFGLEWAELKKGKVYSGKIKDVVPFGLFVDLGAPVDGLLHRSKIPPKMDRTRLVRGQPLRVRIVAVDEVRERISLDFS